MVRLICAGGAPSSGTTLFADLMDAVPGVVCPPELNIFNSFALYDAREGRLEKVLDRPSGKTKSIYSRNNQFFNRKYITTLKFSDDSLREVVRNSRSSEEFLGALLAHLNLNLEREAQVLCEKTPTNALWAKEFCDRFPDGLFIHITRHGSEVVRSLIRRGYTPYEGALIWMYQVSSALRARDRPNFIEVKYEDIVKNPFEFAAGIASRVGLSVGPDEIASNFRQNSFRASLPRPRQWTVNQYTGEVHSSKSTQSRDPDPELSWVEGSFMLRYANPQAPKILASFSDLLASLGYERTPASESGKELRDAFVGASRDYVFGSKNLDLQRNLRLVTSRELYDKDLIALDNAMIENIVYLRRKLRKIGDHES